MWQLYVEMDPCTGGNGYAHICQSENGVARCVCRPGDQLSEDKKACGGFELEIVNCCEENNCSCSHYCERVLGAGGGHCSCNQRHQLDSDEKTCIDLDECESGERCCAQLCVVVDCLGSYEALDDGKLEEEREN
ncbi:thrombomodulin-like isoform X2 [Vulpes vulpes]|uniref:Thrombomodulin-like isoform X2 n=2 Tax=Vulpes vulpes TaxID=9627 RepID=A0ABM5A0S5_VULVU